MSELVLFYVTIIIFGLIYIALALLPRKKIKNKTDYFLAGRNLTVMKATCTLIATQLGAGLLLGTSQEAYKMGLYGLLFTFGVSIGLIILGCGIAGRLRALNIATTTQIFEMKYHSQWLRKIASLLVTFTLCGILVGNMVASKALFTSLHVQSDILFLIFWLFIVVYTMVGGLHAVVLTDLVQVLFVALVFIGVTLYSLCVSPPHLSLDALKMAQEHFTGQLPPWSNLSIILLMPALFALFEQDLAQIFFASKTKRVATITAILTTLFILSFGLIPIYLGMQAKLIGITIAGNESPLLEMIRSLTGNFMVVMVACGVLAAIASTADALLCAIGANLTQDFDLSFLHLSSLIESKVVTFAMGIIVLISSYFMPTDIIHILVKSYEVPVCCLLVSILFAYFRPAVRKWAGITSLIAGGGSLAFFYLMPVPFYELYALLISLVGYGVGHFIDHDTVQPVAKPIS